MKKLAILLLVCLWGAGAMAELPVNFGIHGGVSSNRVNFKDLRSVHGSEANTGYMVGAFMRANFGKLYLEPALNYSHKKSTAKGMKNDPATSRENFNLEMNTFDIPVMVGLKVLDFSVVKIRAFVGPELTVGKIRNLKKLGDISADKANWRGKAGIGLDVWKLTFDMDYEKGFKKLSHELKAPRSFNFTLGFKII
ncbi:MAG: PorT family protein [Odoribacter sp.]|nr:PorT family protein [Odoribacter sp.]